MADIASVFGRHEFLIRRLHSFTGLVPVGGFLVIHLLTNLGILDNSYQQRVDLIHSMGDRTLEVTEWTLHLPAHPLPRHHRPDYRGQGQAKPESLSVSREFPLYAARWTGVIAFAFIFWHVFQTRGWINNSSGGWTT